VIGEGLVGSILSYLAGEVPGETGSPGQANKLQGGMTLLKLSEFWCCGRKYPSRGTRLRGLEIEIDRKFEGALPDQIPCKTSCVHWWEIAKAENLTSQQASKTRHELTNQYSLL